MAFWAFRCGERDFDIRSEELRGGWGEGEMSQLTVCDCIGQLCPCV